MTSRIVIALIGAAAIVLAPILHSVWLRSRVMRCPGSIYSDGHPVSDVLVTADGHPGSTFSDTSGFFSLAVGDAAEGDLVAIRLSRDGYTQTVRTWRASGDRGLDRVDIQRLVPPPSLVSRSDDESAAGAPRSVPPSPRAVSPGQRSDDVRRAATRRTPQPRQAAAATSRANSGPRE